MSVGKICVRSVVIGTPGETAREAARRMTKDGVGTVVVVDESRRPIGILTDRDVMTRCVAEGGDPDKIPIADIMSAPVGRVRESTAIEEGLAEMVRHGVRRLPVVDDDDRLVGILALDDVLELLAEETTTIGRLLAKSRA